MRAPVVEDDGEESDIKREEDLFCRVQVVHTSRSFSGDSSSGLGDDSCNGGSAGEGDRAEETK